MEHERPAASATAAQQELRDLYGRPGFLLRRAHQISSAIFIDAAGKLNVTTTQFGVLIVLAAREPVDQIGIAKDLQLDRSTTGLVIRNLAEQGLIERVTDPQDRRRRVLRLTDNGRELLDRLREVGKRSYEKSLSVFSPEEAEAFTVLLKKFNAAHDAAK